MINILTVKKLKPVPILDAYDELCENLGDLQTAARGTEDDVQFLRDFLNNPALASLIQVILTFLFLSSSFF